VTTERYDPTSAAHYSAYRPPLHPLILRRVLSEGESFGAGLDVGCGTGYSATALAAYCARVYGIDPSLAMLREAAAHERVSYFGGAAERIPLPDHSVEVVTFAGSLFYADVGAAGAEVRRVGRGGGLVVAYDFEILLDEVLRRCGVDPDVVESDYDHRASFSGIAGFTELEVGSERVGLRVSPAELAHLLLSDSHRYDRLATRYRASDPFPMLAEEIRSMDDHAKIEADIYYSKYRIAAG
jgi:ubiquinone/menaquinone biosynthesis C-methylase UbiE